MSDLSSEVEVKKIREYISKIIKILIREEEGRRFLGSKIRQEVQNENERIGFSAFLDFEFAYGTLSNEI